MREQTRESRIKSHRLTGLLFLIIGGVWLLRLSGYPLPSWMFSWEMILIMFGLFIGIRHGFRDFSWLVFIAIGSVFMLDNIWPDIHLKKYAWPIVIMAVGLLLILAPKKACGGPRRWNRNSPDQAAIQENVPETPVDFDQTNDTTLDIVSIFGGVKKKVLSKQFAGGEIVCVLGGTQINLANADFKSPVVLDLVQIFGGTKLVVPANWEVRSEIAAIFGGVDDKRPQPANAVPEKVVVLKGTIIFGGVEVNSY